MFDQREAMLERPFGIILIAAALLAAGFVGIAAFWGVFPSNTSPRSLFVLNLLPGAT